MAVHKLTVSACICSSYPLLALTLRSVHDHQGAQPSTVHHGVHHPSPQAPSSTALRKTPAALIDAAGGLKSGNGLTSPARANGATEDHTFESDDDEVLSGLQEVNLLEGLASGESSVVWIAFDADGILQVPPSMTLQGDCRCPPSD